MIEIKKRGERRFLAEEAISSLDTSTQKPINVAKKQESNFDERLMNSDKFNVNYNPKNEPLKTNFSNDLNSNDSNRINKLDFTSHNPTNNINKKTDFIKKEQIIIPSKSKTDNTGSYSNNTFTQKKSRIHESNFENSFIKWFSDITNKDIKIAGGKGASLGEMYNHKFPVPSGFVITAQAYEFFINDIQEQIKKVIEKTNVENTEELNRASKEIRGLIEKQEFTNLLREEILESYKILSTDKTNNYLVDENALNILRTSKEPIFVSVRSSATTEDLADASFAGQQESFLNVKGERNLIEHIKKCFSSLYTPRAIYYRHKKGFFESYIAVVVQKMINSEKSGVVFSKDPIKQTDDIVIEAVFGLGEGIVSGKINPDYYLVSRDLKVEDIIIGDKKIAMIRTGSGENETIKLTDEKSRKQVLNTSELLEIANYALKLEEHYNKPQDIEFAVESGEVFIIQSRPITTLGKKQDEIKVNRELEGKIILRGLSASPGIGVGVVKIIKDISELVEVKKGDVLVTKMTNPDMVVSMQKSTAIITDEGGMTSHAAIVSREMGIPAVVGTGKATEILTDGMKITVDGFNGKIYEGEVSESRQAEIKKVIQTNRIKLKVILDLPDFASRAAETGISSVGLLRLEGIIASSGKHPLLYEKENKLQEYSKLLENGIYKITKSFNSIWIRTSDIRTDEFSSLQGSPEKEVNPMLGFHGIRFSLKHPKILMAELEAVKNVALAFPQKKFGVMFPQIISLEEIKEAKKYFEEFKTLNMNIGAMIETPSAVQIIEEISNEVDFISFGTNDLTQYTLAVDRGEEDVQYLYNELHPSIFSQIKKVIDVCRKKNVETSICGQAGSKKEMVEFLFRKGINSISLNADAAYDISFFINELEKNWETHREEKFKQNQKNQEDLESKNKETADNIIYNKANKSSSSSNNLNSFNKNNLKNKKWEKFRRWKEKKKMWKERNNRFDENKNMPWGKKAEFVFDNLKITNQKQIEKSLLNKEKIQISAEREGVDESEYDENIGPIEPFDNLERIKEKSEELVEEVKEKVNEEIKERREIEADIKVSGKRIEEQ